jgi:Holliday junction resolvasome RuvABC endonuclease subunit
VTASAAEVMARIEASGKPTARKSKKEWVAPVGEDFDSESVLAFDQTLTHTGWAILRTFEGHVRVMLTGMCTPRDEDGLTSLILTLWRASEIGDQVHQVLAAHSRSVDAVVHEMPAVHGMRLESSLLAAREVQRCWREVGAATSLTPVYNQHMEKVLLHPDDRQVDKKRHVKEAVLRYVDLSMLPKGSRLNEHVYDAMALGLTHLYDRKRAGS